MFLEFKDLTEKRVSSLLSLVSNTGIVNSTLLISGESQRNFLDLGDIRTLSRSTRQFATATAIATATATATATTATIKKKNLIFATILKSSWLFREKHD